MARPRKPSNVLALNGAFKRNPGRHANRLGEPAAVTPIGDPPEYFPASLAECWHEIVGQAHKGTLCGADRLYLEYACTVLAEMRADTRARIEWLEGDPDERGKHPGGIDTKLGIRWEAICGRLGITPADRSRVTALADRAPSDPFAEFRQ